jgi:hypothetical protein
MMHKYHEMKTHPFLILAHHGHIGFYIIPGYYILIHFHDVFP